MGKSNSSVTLAESSPYPLINANQLIHDLTKKIILTAWTHGKDPDMDAKVANAFVALNKNKIGFLKQYTAKPGRFLASHLIMGPPAHGKSTVVKIASQNAAELLKLNFLEAGDIGDRTPTKDDFLFIKLEMAGQTSAISLGGIPIKATSADGVNYMDILPSKPFSCARAAGASMLLIDDLPNASPHIFSAMLGVIQDRSYSANSLGQNCSVAITGNLGKGQDGTVGTNMLGNAVISRCITVYFQDQPEQWLERYNKEMASEAKRTGEKTGVDGLLGFLHNNPDVFNQEPTKDGSPYCSPRTLDVAVKTLGSTLMELTSEHGVGNIPVSALHGLERDLSGSLGKSTAARFKNYYYSYLSGIAPLIENYMSDDPNKQKGALAKLKKKVGGGMNAEEQDAIAQICFGTSDILAAEFCKLKGDEKEDFARVKEISERASDLHGLTVGKVSNSPAFTASLISLRQRIDAGIDEKYMRNDKSVRSDFIINMAYGYKAMLAKVDNTAVTEQFVDSVTKAGLFAAAGDFHKEEGINNIKDLLGIADDSDSGLAPG